jgi:hypothetical protein
MNTKTVLHSVLIAAAFGAAALAARVTAADFSVTPFGLSAYVINGTNNPTLTLERGVTYVFSVNASGHPFFIKTNATTTTANAYNDGVTGNGVQIGTLTFAVPATAPSQLFYHCSVHSTMGGNLNIIDSPTPPSVTIVYISVSDTGVMMKSTGAANWTAIPEFNSNLTSTTWATVPNFTNTFNNGTNTTTFDRLDPVCGPNVFLRVRNQPN